MSVYINRLIALNDDRWSTKKIFGQGQPYWEYMPRRQIVLCWCDVVTLSNVLWYGNKAGSLSQQAAQPSRTADHNCWPILSFRQPAGPLARQGNPRYPRTPAAPAPAIQSPQNPRVVSVFSTNMFPCHQSSLSFFWTGILRCTQREGIWEPHYSLSAICRHCSIGYGPGPSNMHLGVRRWWDEGQEALYGLGWSFCPKWRSLTISGSCWWVRLTKDWRMDQGSSSSEGGLLQKVLVYQWTMKVCLLTSDLSRGW